MSVVDLHKKNGKRPKYDIYIGRAVEGTEFKQDSKWANYFQNLLSYEQYIIIQIQTNPKIYNLEELRGKVLGCWCITTSNIENPICHGQILLKLLKCIKEVK